MEEEEEDGVTVYVLLPNGQSVAGEPFGIYTPIASTLPAGAYHSGVVGANNGLALPALPAGTYQLKIAPADGDLIEFSISVSNTNDVLTVNLQSGQEQQYVWPVDGDTYFVPTSDLWFDEACGWRIGYAADQSGGAGTVTFSNESGWSQVANVTVDADTGVASGYVCIPDIEQTPDALVIDIVMNSGGTFRYYIQMIPDVDPVITGGLLVTSATEQPGTTPTPGSSDEAEATPTQTPVATDPPAGQPAGQTQSDTGVTTLPATGSGATASGSALLIVIMAMMCASLVFVAGERINRRQG